MSSVGAAAHDGSVVPSNEMTIEAARRRQRPGEEPVPGTLPASVQLATIADSTPPRMSSSQVTVLGAGARVST